jgi:dTDP-4-amino-4,6-dideoxyglucose formyltransferase
VHPGLNPYNRGWFPQVFSILNKMPLGATIHEIDEKLDHGPILVQKEVPVHACDTSLTAYNRVLDAEIDLMRNNLCDILNDTIVAKPMPYEGNLNLKANFDALCELDLDKVQTIGETIDLLRALTHGSYKNGFLLISKPERKYSCQFLYRNK